MGTTLMPGIRACLVAALFAVVTGTAGAQGPVAPSADSTTSIDRIVAVVGDQPILRSEVEEELGKMKAEGQQMPTDSAAQQQLVTDIINGLIDDDVMVAEAKKQKIEVNDNDISGEVDKQVAQIRGRFASDAEYRQQLKLSGFGTPDEYRRWLMDKARRTSLQQKLFEKLRQEDKLPPAPVSEAEVDSFFQASKGQIPKLPATITYRQIVITPQPSAKEDSTALAKAESLLVEIRKGGDFATIAKRESMDLSNKDQGGDLGWHRRGEFVPNFDRVYFALRPGQVSPVIKTTFGYHIIKVDRVQPSEVKGRHILIRPAIDSADVQRARVLADSVAKLWRNGANFDSLVAKYHDPSEEKIMPDPFPQAQLPKEYQAAIKGHKAGDILDPFTIMDASRGVPKFFILELTAVDSAREPTLADYRQDIRDRLTQQKGVRRYLDNLRKQTFVSIRE
ncbi:MAG TPA: peptidylprolyl isomerase [Gemmatimonadaceae bacterium]